MIFTLYWGRVDVLRCISFRSTARRFNYMYICIYSLKNLFPFSATYFNHSLQKTAPWQLLSGSDPPPVSTGKQRCGVFTLGAISLSTSAASVCPLGLLVAAWLGSGVFTNDSTCFRPFWDRTDPCSWPGGGHWGRRGSWDLCFGQLKPFPDVTHLQEKGHFALTTLSCFFF